MIVAEFRDKGKLRHCLALKILLNHGAQQTSNAIPDETKIV
jgi:hypothetical protein